MDMDTLNPEDKSQENQPTNTDDKKKGFLERGKKGNDSHDMGNDISGDLKIANSNGEMEGGDDKTWHINEGK